MIENIPSYKIDSVQKKVFSFKKKQNPFCLCIPVINEGERIQNQIKKLYKEKIYNIVDIIILDGGSSDNSLDIKFLEKHNITSLLIKEEEGKLGTQLRMGYSWALEQGYEGVITIDGNEKDSIESIPHFIEKLKEGFDLVKGSRFIKGGNAINTPLSRLLAIKLIHSPYISFLSKKKWTDTTNAYAAYSSKLLLDENISIFRTIFNKYQILFYLQIKSVFYGYKTIEIPVTRTYPPKGKVPTKITWLGNLEILKNLWELSVGYYDTDFDPPILGKESNV